MTTLITYPKLFQRTKLFNNYWIQFTKIHSIYIMKYVPADKLFFAIQVFFTGNIYSLNKSLTFFPVISIRYNDIFSGISVFRLNSIVPLSKSDLGKISFQIYYYLQYCDFLYLI